MGEDLADPCRAHTGHTAGLGLGLGLGVRGRVNGPAAGTLVGHTARHWLTELATLLGGDGMGSTADGRLSGIYKWDQELQSDHSACHVLLDLHIL